MNIPTIGQLLTSRLSLPGFVFLFVNLTTSYMFYQVNSYKIFLLGLGVTVMAVCIDLLFPRKTEDQIPWKMLGCLSLPTLATIPGYFWYKGLYNYNFSYELAAFVMLIVWAVYLYRGVQREEDLSPFFFLLGITLLYTGVWAALERIGYHPLSWDALPVPRVKATFGNINYFAGFLVVMTPLFFVLAIPVTALNVSSIKEIKKLFLNHHRFYLVVFLMACLSLYLTQTRAAWAGELVGLLVTIALFALFFSSDLWRRRISLFLIGGFVVGTLTVALLFLFREQLQDYRIAGVFNLSAWASRLGSWEAAISSILASPLIGFGLGSSYALFFHFVSPEVRLYSSQHSYNHVHSEILEYIQESGALGAIVFLIFWGYLAVQLVKLLRSEDASTFSKKIAIGVIGASIAYHVHGLFSVAPRMMVMRLPLYTIIALAFIVMKLRRGSNGTFEKRGVIDRLMLFSPFFVLMGLFWVLYIPWIIGQYRFVKIQQERPSLRRVERLEALVHHYPDAYALDFLSHAQIRYQRIAKLEETVKIIDRILPDYRELGHTKAMLALFKRDRHQAILNGLEFQKRDLYFEPTITLLMSLALETNDFDLFWNQFKLYYRRLIFEQRVDGGRTEKNVIIEKAAFKAPFEIGDRKDEPLVIRWNEALISRFFQIGRSARVKREYEKKEKNGLINFLIYLFSRHPYFQIEIFDEYRQKETGKIRETVMKYFKAEREWGKISRPLTKKHNRQLALATSFERPSLRKKQFYEEEAKHKPFKKEIETYEQYLLKRTKWKMFLRKRKMAQTFIRKFPQLIFPPTMGI